MVAFLSSAVAIPPAQRSGLFTVSSSTVWQDFDRLDLPLEALVHCLRQIDDPGCRNRLLEIIVQRTQASNERWASYILYTRAVIPRGTCATLADDLYADLCERMLRAVLDPERRYWEENFQHALIYERKHVYYAFLIREGYCRTSGAKVGERILRTQLQSVELLEVWEARDDLGQEDQQAQELFDLIEASELHQLVMQLPGKWRVVIYLLFWEGRTEKEVASLLGVSDRTVRNHLRKALQFLQRTLSEQAGGEL